MHPKAHGHVSASACRQERKIMRQEWLGSEKAGLTDKNGGMLQKIDRVSKKRERHVNIFKKPMIYSKNPLDRRKS